MNGPAVSDDAARPSGHGPGDGHVSGRSELDGSGEAEGLEVPGVDEDDEELGDGVDGPDPEFEGDDEDEPEDDDGERRRAPWHFKIILVGTIIYLGYRAFQGVEWLIHHA